MVSAAHKRKLNNLRFKKWYQRNKKTHLARTNAVRNRKILWLKSLKKGLKCSKCGCDNPICLDFHHTKNKKGKISYLVHTNQSKKIVLKEIKKCIVLCANCHRILHLLEPTLKSNNPNTKWRRDKAVWFYNLKNNLACSNCGFKHPRALDFHHKNPDDKKYTVSQMLSGCSREKILVEISKCIPLCANCHRLLHNS